MTKSPGPALDGIRLACLPSLLGLMAAGCLAPQRIALPDGSVVGEDAVAVVRLENPLLQGNVDLTVTEELFPSTRFLAVRIMSVDGAYLTANRPGVISDRWLWSDAPVRSSGIGAPPFLAPAVSLPMGGEPVELSLHTKRGRRRTVPVAGGTIPPPIGFNETVVARLSIALDRRVLVLPVRVHRFARFPATLGTITPEFVSQLFDPGAVATESVLSTDSGHSSEVTVVSGRLPRTQAEPDSIWTQCDIQFHLESHEIIFQNQGLENVQTNCVCNRPPEAIRPFLDGRDGRDAIDIFFGGTISGDGCSFGSSHGSTCGPTNSGSGGSCDDEVARHRHNRIHINIDRLGSIPNLLSHELGHLLGLRHPDDPFGECGVTDTADARNLLMFAGGGGTEPHITRGQCDRARCIAARWLTQFGRLSPDAADEVCR